MLAALAAKSLATCARRRLRVASRSRSRAGGDASARCSTVPNFAA